MMIYDESDRCAASVSAASRYLRDRSNDTDRETNDATAGDVRRSRFSAVEEPAVNSESEDVEKFARKFAMLDLDDDREYPNDFAALSVEDPPEESPLAGFVTAVAKQLGFIVVKPPMPRDFLLHLGSPVFLTKLSSVAVSSETKIGRIIDVFGPACEPYYCVKPARNAIDLVREGTRLSYAPDNPLTRFVRLERGEGGRYKLFYSKRRPPIIDQRRVGGIHAGEEIRSRDTRDGGYSRSRCRRRAAGNRRTFHTARRTNSYTREEEPSGSHAEIRPKHSYFYY